MTQDMDLVRRWARRYYDMGMNPLPSRGDGKRPALQRFAHYLHHARIPESWLARWWAPNIQVALGSRWGLCVVDIDGAEALYRWASFSKSPHNRDDAWVSYSSYSSGSGSTQSPGCHVWYRLPLGTGSFRTTIIWQGISKHQEIKVLGDGGLVVAPPSIHPVKRTRYEWLTGPDQLRWPAWIPDWLLRRIEESRQKSPAAPRPRPIPRGLLLGDGFGRHYQRDEVLYGMGDRKHEFAAAYGLEVARHPATSGYYACRSISRDDNNWSCSIHPSTGVYTDWTTGEKLPFFSVLMRLDPGTFPDYSTTVDLLGAYVFGGQPCPQSIKSKIRSSNSPRSTGRSAPTA